MRRLRVYCLDVGQGDCTFVLPPDNAPAILFDCRDAHVAWMFANNHDPPITHLSAIVFSHLNWDHIAGGEQFIKDFLTEGGTIDQVFIDADRPLSNDTGEAKGAKSFVDFVMARHAMGAFDLLPPRADPAQVDRLSTSRDWSVRIVGPTQRLELGVDRGEFRNVPNVHSAVLRVAFGGKSINIGGDAPLASWAQISEGDRRANAFRIPHHGGRSTTGERPRGGPLTRSTTRSRQAMVSFRWARAIATTIHFPSGSIPYSHDRTVPRSVRSSPRAVSLR